MDLKTWSIVQHLCKIENIQCHYRKTAVWNQVKKQERDKERQERRKETKEKYGEVGNSSILCCRLSELTYEIKKKKENKMKKKITRGRERIRRNKINK